MKHDSETVRLLREFELIDGHGLTRKELRRALRISEAQLSRIKSIAARERLADKPTPDGFDVAPIAIEHEVEIAPGLFRSTTAAGHLLFRMPHVKPARPTTRGTRS